MPSAIFKAQADRMNGGLNENTDRNLKLEEISGGRSLRFEQGAGIYTGPGYQLRATVVADKSGRGAIEANFIRSTAWAKVGTKIKYTHDSVNWYDTGATVTDAIRQGFVQQSNGDILTSNQTDAPIVFAVGQLKAAATQAGSELDVGSVWIGKFVSPAGTAYINGTAVPYTGVSGTKLTGATIPASGFEAGELVVQARTQTTWVEEKGTILMTVEGRTLVMNVKDHENIVYYSAIEDLANPEFAYDFDGNGSFQKEMPGRITGALKGVSGGYIILEKGVHQILGFDIQSGGLMTEEISSEEGAYNQDCVVDMGGIGGFMGRNRFFPITLTLDPKAEAAPYLGENFDFNIRPWLQTHDAYDMQKDYAFCKWDSTQRILKLGAIVNGALEVRVFDRQNPGYLPHENRPIGTSFMLDGKSYFIHRDTGKCYEDDYGRTNDGSAITHIIRSATIQNDTARSFLKGQYFSYEGWMTQGTLHTLRMYLDGASDPFFEREYSWEDLIDLSRSRSIGVRGIGISTPGGSSGEVTRVYPYDNPILIKDVNADSFVFEIEVSGEGHFLQLNTWKFTAHPTRRQPRTKN